MTDDMELIKQRQARDDVRFMVNALDPEQAPRLAPAVRALRDLVADGWASHTATLAAMLRASDLAVKTADSLMRRAVTAGLVERRGEYSRTRNRRTRQWEVRDTRAYRLVNWPESC